MKNPTHANDMVACGECKAEWHFEYFNALAKWQENRYLQARRERAQRQPPPSPSDSTYSAKYPDGSEIHVLFDGRTIKLRKNGLVFALHYQSHGAGYYETEIYVLGLSERRHLFEAWSYDRSGLRSFAFSKTLRLIDLRSRQVFSGIQLCKFLGGTYPP